MTSPTLEQRVARIRLLVLDADGVLTEGRIFYDHQGHELRVFDVRDGHGLKLLTRAGYEVAIISGRTSQANQRRASELGIEELHQDVKIKLPVLEDLLQRKGLTWEQAAYMGDDLIDLPAMRAVGLALAPADADPEALKAAHWVSSSPGGRGAVRQACELILKLGGAWEKVTGRYFE